MYVSTLLLSSNTLEKGIRFHYSCEPSCCCWELNSGPLEEQSVLLTAEPSLQPCFISVLAEAWSWVPSTHIRWLTTLCCSNLRGSDVLLCLPQTSVHMLAYVHIHMHAQLKRKYVFWE